MREQIIKEGKRVDGRELNEVRAIDADAAVLPNRVHGSALFQRGLTQVLPLQHWALQAMLRKWTI